VNAIDLFAGPGGWDLALDSLGIEPLGIEWDDAAVATRAAAGLRSKQADVSKLDPNDFAPCELILASAPCPTYSSAGNGGGRLLTDLVVRCLHELAAGNDTRPERREEAFEVLLPIYWEREQEKARKKKREADREKTEDRARRDADMSLLVVEPLRWVLALEPRFVALEQVPEVLGLWSEIAAILGVLGYSTWIGVMEAERYGVPQTRERAILMADRVGPVHPPRPTHQRYVKGEPQRHEITMEGEILPWVSMAEALSWGLTERPSLTFLAKSGEGGSPGRIDGGSGSRRSMATERERGAWVEGPEPSPAPTVSGGGTGSGGGVEVFAGKDARERARRAAERVSYRNGNRVNAAERPLTEPVPTLTANGLAKSTHQRVRSGHTNANGPEFDAAERPARTIAGDVSKWVRERPATSVCGDPRISPPGYRGRSDEYDADGNYTGARSMDNAIRVTEEEALVLQSFPPDYPVQGTKSKRYEQIGNAVPPLLAHAILSSLLAPVLEHPTEIAA